MSSDDPNKYNFPYRVNYEIRILIVWFVAGVLCCIAPYFFNVPKQAYWFCGIGCFLASLVFGRNGIEIYIRKKRLKGYPLEFINPNSDSSLKMFGITDKEVLENVRKNRE